MLRLPAMGYESSYGLRASADLQITRMMKRFKKKMSFADNCIYFYSFTASYDDEYIRKTFIYYRRSPTTRVLRIFFTAFSGA